MPSRKKIDLQKVLARMNTVCPPWRHPALGGQREVGVLYTIADTPQFAGSIPSGNLCFAAAGSYSCSAPTDVKTDGTGPDAYFSDFITALVTRYKGQIINEGMTLAQFHCSNMPVALRQHRVLQES